MLRIERILSTTAYQPKKAERIEAQTKETLEPDAVELDGERNSGKDTSSEQQEREERREARAEEKEEQKARDTHRALNIIA